MAKIDTLFEQLIANKGSDLHMAQGQRPKIRSHGQLKPLDDHDPLTEESILSYIEEIADEEAWKTFLDNGDLDFAYNLPDNTRFRANYYRQFYGYGAIFRMIPSEILTLEQLDLPDALQNFAKLRSGLVLITGPTGSGKSTTLAAVIDYINASKTVKIITIEEPVEFIHKNKKSIITHREVGLDTHSFATGLQGALKSDANIILVGEMRDQETIELALTAAEKGILVFGTLHTNSAAKTIDRIIDVFPTKKKNQIRTILANNLQGVVAQQLLPSADKSRRWVALEILLRTPSLSTIIRNGETTKIASEIQLNQHKGMIQMDNCLRMMVQEGKVTEEDAYLMALDKDGFKQSSF